MKIKNMTLSKDVFQNLLSASLPLNWWEHHWVLKAKDLDNHGRVLFLAEVKLYFLTYVQKQRFKQNLLI